MATAALTPKRRRWYARPWPIASIVAVLFVLWCARGPLLGPLVAHLAASSLADATGGHAAVAQAGGGWLGDAHAAGVTLSGPGAEPAWTVQVGRVEAAYGLGLLRGDLAALHRLDITGMQVELRPGPATAQGGPAPWPALLARLPPTLPQVRVAGDIVVRDGDSQVRVSGLDLRIAGEQVELSVQRVVVGGRELALPRCALRRSAPDALSLAEPMRFELPGLAEPVLCEHLELVLGEHAQQVTADGRLAGGTWRVAASSGATRLEVRGVDLTALGLLPAALGRTAVDLDLVQVADGWEIRDLHLAGDGVRLSARTGLRSDPWRCHDLDAVLDVDLARLGRVMPALAQVAGRMRATLRGSAGLPPAQWRHSDLTLAIAGDGVVVAGQPCTPLQGTLRIVNGTVGIEALDVAWNGMQASLAGAGPEAPPSDAGAWRLVQRPIRCAGGLIRAEGGVDDAGGLAGVVHLEGLPLAGLPGLSILRHVQGMISGRLDLGGTLLHPTWLGALAVDGLEAKFSPSVPTLTTGQARLTLADGMLDITDLHGELGGARFDASGRVRVSGGEQAIDLVCRGRNLLLLQRPDARVRADLDLRLGGTLSVPALSGHVKVVSALFTPELHLDGGASGGGDGRLLLFELPDPPWSLMRFDVQVASAPPVADTDAGVRVVTRWGRGTCDLDLNLGGTGAAPEPQGRVSVRDGVATLPFSTLKVTHGGLVFPPGEPFQPRLTAIAGARIRQYDVQVQVTGTLDKPVVQVSGSGLDEQEATLLLTTGSTPRELQAEQGQRAAIGRVGAWLGQETWRSIEGPDDPDAGPSLTERVTIEWGREATSQGRDTIDSEVELTQPGSDPALLLYGKRDRYDEYNAGVVLRLYWGGEEE